MKKLHLLGPVCVISFRKLILLGALLLANDSYAALISALPASSYNADVSIMDSALGIDSSYNVEDFENDVFISGFELTYRRPNASTEHQLIEPGLPQTWDGDRILYIVGGDRISDNGGAIFTFDQGLNSFGIGLANLQLSGWYVEVNGQRLVDELLSISGISASSERNGYLFINAEQGEVIDNVVIDRDELGDRVNFDHLALQVSSTIPIPPAIWLFGSGLLGLIGMARRKKTAELLP